MKDLVKALNNFGGKQTQPRVVVKGNNDTELPKFGGEPEKWIEFSEEFARTNEKYQYEDSENLVRLRKSLVGTAKQTVAHLMSNVRNVTVIMETLKKRFGRPKMVLNALAAKAKNCGNVTTAKPESIIEFGLAVQGLVANIDAFGEIGYAQDCELLDSLVKKLSPDLATRWYEWLADRGKRESLNVFSIWLEKQLDIAYQRADVKIEDSSELKTNFRNRRDRQVGSVNASTGDEPKCLCCDKTGHALSSCFSFKKKTLDEKWKIVNTSGVCMCGLKPGHKVKDCDKSRFSCSVQVKLDGCEKLHHRLLHKGPAAPREERPPQHVQAPQQEHPPQNEDQQRLINDGRHFIMQGAVAIIRGCDGPLPIVPGKVKGPLGTVKVHLLLDTGASRSLMRKDIAKKIGATGTAITYTYRGVTGGSVTDRDAALVDCEASGTLRGSKYLPLRGTVTLDDIQMSPYSINIEKLKQHWPHLKNVPVYTLDQVVPDIIVGNNNPHLILAQKIIQDGYDKPMAWRSTLGWAITGDVTASNEGSVNHLCGSGSMDDLHNLVKQSFSFEDFGVRLSTTAGKTLEEKRAYDILEKTTKLVDGVWETGLLWRKDNVSFPDNETAAIRRLIGTERKMKDPVYNKMYSDKIQEYKEKEYIRKLTPEEKVCKKNTTNIIPHFGQTNPNKPGKFRFIMDAKAETNGVSLNSQLLKGPDLIRPLVGVLWNFRKHQIGLTEDIADMFHRIRIRKEDQDSQRLLWRDGDSSREPDHYVMNVMIFGATSFPSSAMFVKNKNASLFSEKYPAAAAATVTDFYVDDALLGGATVEEVIELRKQLSEIHAAGSFKLCKWMSNSAEVIRSIPEDLRADGVKNFEDKDIPGERVLGMWWDPAEDTFQFKLGFHKVPKSILEGSVPTKRQMCGLIMSLYDPMGFIAHFKIKGLMLLQEVWRDGIGWDDEVETVTFEKWRGWIAQLKEVKKVKVPRCYSKLLPSAENMELHTFVDASAEAFCAVSYLRVQLGDCVEVAFIAAKARVAPLKKSTIPKLELQAALLGSRLAKTILEELRININKKHFWSDSTTVLFWLRSRAGRLPEFIANRVGEIQESTDPLEWHWVPTKLNVADIGTRFESDVSLSPDTVWYRGPAFLYDKESSWDFEDAKSKSEIEDEAIVAVVLGEEKKSNVSPIREIIPPPERFSSYPRAVRATAGVICAARYWIGYIRNRQNPPAKPWTVKVPKKPLPRSSFYSKIPLEDIFVAVKQLLKVAQEESFGDNSTVLKRKGDLWKLSPMIDKDGLIRVDGRIDAAKDISFNTRSPIILPSGHYVTGLIVQFEHEKNAHQGLETVVANIRQKFWLIAARQTVGKWFRKCKLCQIRKDKPVNPRMGPLPAVRLESHSPPFTFTGVDLFGPMEVTVCRHVEKRWGVIFCCMVMRAVHLEIVHSLSTDDFMMALSRFIDTRGRPKELLSDNGTNFVGTVRVINELWDEVNIEEIGQQLEFQQIKWTFNPPAAPHMGGAWERLVQTAKKCMKGVLNEKRPQDSTLLTVMKAVENMMNSRPLTYQSTDVNDPGVITPNHILRGSCFAGPAIPNVQNNEGDSFRQQWQRSLVLADQFWKQWTKFYLPKLLLREEWHESQAPLEAGSLVLMIDDHLPSNMWIRGYVSKVFPGKDNEIRSVEVTTSDFKTKKKTTFRRAVSRLAPLGLKMEIKDPEVP